VSVPVLGVDAQALPLGTGPDGALEVPSTAQGLGWYSAGAVPGDPGPAVLAGHVDLDGERGVFHRLGTLEAGDAVTVQRPDGAEVSFVVTAVEQHAKDAFPTERVYGPTAEPTLRLITCGGAFEPRSGSYRDNVVVFARVSGTTPG
jgi:LPXTG-site transpeptidase (sortase) family protein